MRNKLYNVCRYLAFLTHRKYFINDHGDDVSEEEEKDGPWGP